MGLEDVIPLCCAAGTLVSRSEGSVPIEAVQVGDLVWALDTDMGASGLFTVTDVFSHPADVLVEVTIDGDLIRATEEHPFWVMDEGWVSAADLGPGDCVRMLAGGCGEVMGYPGCAHGHLGIQFHRHHGPHLLCG